LEMNLKDRIGFIAGDIWHLLKKVSLRFPRSWRT